MVGSCGRCVFSLLKIGQKWSYKLVVPFCIPISNSSSEIQRNELSETRRGLKCTSVSWQKLGTGCTLCGSSAEHLEEVKLQRQETEEPWPRLVEGELNR